MKFLLFPFCIMYLFVQGSKWTLSSLWKYFRSMNIETEPIWTKSKNKNVAATFIAYLYFSNSFVHLQNHIFQLSTL